MKVTKHKAAKPITEEVVKRRAAMEADKLQRNLEELGGQYAGIPYVISFSPIEYEELSPARAAGFGVPGACWRARACGMKGQESDRYFFGMEPATVLSKLVYRGETVASLHPEDETKIILRRWVHGEEE